MMLSFFDISWAVLNKALISSNVKLSILATALREQTSTCPGKKGLMFTVAKTCSLSKKIWVNGRTYFPNKIVSVLAIRILEFRN